MSLFGRRKPEEARELPKHIIPPELWDDPKFGEMLKLLGKKPDDPDNLTLTPERVAQMLADGKARVARRAREINEEIVGKGVRNAQVQPFWLIQENCWTGDMGHFLIFVLRLNPFDDWNIVYLPETEMGSAILDLPVHPRGVLPVFADFGAEQIRALQQQLMTSLAETEENFRYGDYADAQNETIKQVQKLAQYFSRLLVEAHDKTKLRQN